MQAASLICGFEAVVLGFSELAAWVGVPGKS
jgi:hypothetical protein